MITGASAITVCARLSLPMRETVPQRRGESTDARAYIRCYDANGKLRVFCNNYNKSKYY